MLKGDKQRETRRENERRKVREKSIHWTGYGYLESMILKEIVYLYFY